MSNSILISYFKTPVGELILGSLADKLCLCDWRYRKKRNAIDARIKKGLNAEFKEATSDVIEETIKQLTEYFESGHLQEKGIPSIEHIANKMLVSQRYLSDTLKKETGKTTTEHLQLYLIDEAKSILLEPHKSVSEVAYELGFEYPQYFSRLFKKKEGISPSEYQQKYSLN